MASRWKEMVKMIGNVDDVRICIMEALNGLGYKDVKVNRASSFASAFVRETVRQRNYKCDYEIELEISWQAAGEYQKVYVSAFERNSDDVTGICKRRVREVAERLSRVTPPSPEKTGAAFSKEDKLRQRGFIQDSLLDAPEDTAFVLGKLNDSYLTLPARDFHKHVLVCGPTGCGKSTGIFIPNLIEFPHRSAVITEAAAGEGTLPPLYRATAKIRAAAGSEIFYFNPGDLENSTPINPVDFVWDLTSAMHVASVIIRNTENPDPRKNSSEQAFFERLETHLLSLFLWYVSTKRSGKQAQLGDGADLGHIRRMLQKPAAEIGDIFAESCIDELINEYDCFLNTNTETVLRDSLSGLRNRLNLWLDLRVAQLTEITGFDLDELPRRQFTLYLAVEVHRSEWKALAALALGFVFDWVLSRKFAVPVSFMLDEFANYGYVPDLPDYLTVVRNRGIGCVIGIQATEQLRKVYGEAGTLFLSQPATRVFFRPNYFDFAEELSKSLGEKQHGRLVDGNQGDYRKEYVKERLMDPSEILAMPNGEIIVFMPELAPVIASRIAPGAYDRAGDSPAAS